MSRFVRKPTLAATDRSPRLTDREEVPAVVAGKDLDEVVLGGQAHPGEGSGREVCPPRRRATVCQPT
jgi:hypothetical protein